MGLLDHMTFYLDDQTGLIKAADLGKDNEILNVATFFSLCPEAKDDLEWNRKIYRFRQATEVVPGVYKRYPGADDNSVDNAVGMAYVSFNAGLCTIWHGQKNFWTFNPENPKNFKLKYFYGRFVGFRPFILARVGIKLNFIEALLYGLSAIFCSFSEYGNTSDKCLQILMNEKVYGNHFLSNLGIRLFEKLMDKKYPYGRQQLYGIYFGQKHPFTLTAGKPWRNKNEPTT